MHNKLLNSRPIFDPQDTYTLRGICMIMIMIHHVFKLYSGCPDSIIRWGYLGVAVFFLISGWGMYCSMFKNNDVTWKYFWKQMKKLLVPYVFIWPLAEILYVVHHPDYSSATELARDFFSLTFPPFPGLWFFKVIVIAYAISIITFILINNRLGRLIILSLFSVIYYTLAWKILQLPMWWWGTSLCIVAGMWMAAYKDELHKVYNKKYIILIFSIVAYYVTFHYNVLPIPSRTIHSFFFAIAILSFGSVFNIANPILDYIGRNSLLFYLFHIAMCELLVPSMKIFSNQWVALVFILASTTLLCFVYNVVKKQLQK